MSILDAGLFAVDGETTPFTYCGPTAIAALTGAPVVRVEDMVLAWRATMGTPRKSRMPRGCRVRTMWGGEVSPVLRKLGFGCEELVGQEAPTRTLRQTLLRMRAAGHGSAPLLVLISGHFIAVRGDMFVDTNNPKPRFLHAHRFMRCKVKRVWLIKEN